MDDFFRKLFDPDDDSRRTPRREPSFDFHDFKRWLECNDADDNPRPDSESLHKEKMRAKFKERMHRKIRRDAEG